MKKQLGISKNIFSNISFLSMWVTWVLYLLLSVLKGPQVYRKAISATSFKVDFELIVFLVI